MAFWVSWSNEWSSRSLTTDVSDPYFAEAFMPAAWLNRQTLCPDGEMAVGCHVGGVDNLVADLSTT